MQYPQIIPRLMLLIVREIGSGGFIYLLLLLFIYLLIYLFRFFFGGNEVNHPGFETFSKGFFSLFVNLDHRRPRRSMWQMNILIFTWTK